MRRKDDGGTYRFSAHDVPVVMTCRLGVSNVLRSRQQVFYTYDGKTTSIWPAETAEGMSQVQRTNSTVSRWDRKQNLNTTGTFSTSFVYMNSLHYISTEGSYLCGKPPPWEWDHCSMMCQIECGSPLISSYSGWKTEAHDLGTVSLTW